MIRLCLFLMVFAFSQFARSQSSEWIDFNKNGSKDIYEDPARPIEERLDNLVQQMTFDEMLYQLRSWTYLDVDNWNPEELQLGHLGHIAHNASAEPATQKVNLAQKKQIGQTRLGIPLIIFEEALHGLKTVKATSFPQAICLASTWNVDLMSEVSSAIALETKTRGIKQVLSPVVDLGRDPRWGRTQETYGEDPYLASEMAVAFCKSFESNGIITTPKHFVANWGDGGRDSWAMYISERGLRELWFKPYKACVQRAGSRSIMPAYHTFDGVPCSMNEWLLTDIARDDWGFKGFFGTDFNALVQAEELHHVVKDGVDNAAKAINAGLDVEWPKALYYGEPLEKAIEQGLVSEERVKEIARRILRIKFEIGLFDDPYGDVDMAIKTNDSDAHRALARKAAQEGIVLLKNHNHTLPLNENKTKTMLVVGRPAQDVDLGNYSGTDMKKVSLMEALKERYPNIAIKFHPGVESSPTPFSNVSGQLFKSGSQSGIEVKVFDNPDFKGKPYVHKTEKRPVFLRSHGGAWGSPTPNTRWNNKSLIMSGTFTPDKSFSAQLKAEATGQFRLFINDVEVLNNLGSKGKKDGFFDDAVGQIGVITDLGNPSYTSEYSFEDGKAYQFRIKYIHPDVPHMQMSLTWDQNYGFEKDMAELQQLAKEVDVILALPDGIVEGEFKDRSSICYPEAEEQMIKLLAESGKPTVLIMVNGAAMAISSWEQKVPAIIEQWYAGEETGNALTDILFGEVNPSGKLPVTFPQTDGQVPLTYDYRPVGRSTGFQDPLGGKPQYPFGHGLSYTSFKYDNIRLSQKELAKGQSLIVTADITNTGKVAGAEVVQLYLHDEIASVARPVKELKGFVKVSLDAGETKTISIELTPEELSMWDKDMNYVMEPDKVSAWLGASSEDISLTESCDILA